MRFIEQFLVRLRIDSACSFVRTGRMESQAPKQEHLARVVEGLWRVCCAALGEDHLMTLAMETSLRSGDQAMMARAVALLANAPEPLRRRVFWGQSA